jgi:hypothetical protein
MARSLERVHPRPAKHRSNVFEQRDARQEFVLDVRGQVLIFRDEFVMEIDHPDRAVIMHLETYAVKDIHGAA